MEFRLNKGRMRVEGTIRRYGAVEIDVEYLPENGGVVKIQHFDNPIKAIVAFPRISKFLWKEFKEVLTKSKWISMIVESVDIDDTVPPGWPPEVRK